MKSSGKVKLIKLTKRSQDVVLVWSSTRNRYVKSDRSILLVDCPTCGAAKGEPCKGLNGYKGSTHYPRRYLANKSRFLLRPLSIYRDRNLSP